MRDAIWLLPSRGRPELCQRALDSFEAAGMVHQGVVFVDGHVNSRDKTITDRNWEGYRTLRLPDNWSLHMSEEHVNLQGSMSWFYEKYPNLDFYGWLADDLIARSKCFDQSMEMEAGDWYLVYTDDIIYASKPNRLVPERYDRLLAGQRCSGALGWGGELVRTVGSWTVEPGLVQGCIDQLWMEIVGPVSLYKYLTHVQVEHQNYRTGLRPKDKTDYNSANPLIQKDMKVRDLWLKGPKKKAITERLRQVAPVKHNPAFFEPSSRKARRKPRFADCR